MLKNLKITPAMSFVFHSGIGLIVGVVVSVVTAVGQAVLNTGLNIHVIYGAGIAAFLTSLGHSFFALRSNPQTQQAITDVAGELKLSPALVPDLEKFAQQIAVELFKIRTPPVSALQGQQPIRQSTPIAQPSQQNRPSQPPVVNPGNTFQGNQSYPQQQYGGGGYIPPGTADQGQGVWNLATGQVEQVQPPYGSGRPG